jgi:putative membrane protein
MTTHLWQYLLYLKFFAVGLVMMVTYISAYLKITPISELSLIRQGNSACALSLIGTMIGYSITLISSMLHSASMLDFVIWGIGAAVIQVVVYFITTLLIPKANQELKNNNVAVGILFFGLSVSIGILNAASLS